MGVPVFDIETTGWSLPISVGFYTGEDYYEFMRESESDDVIWRFLTFLKQFPGIKLYAHCAAKFDNKFILHSLCQHDEKISLEAGLAKLKWVEPNISFEDSYLLVPMSLEKACKLFEVGEKGEWKHDLGLKPWEMGSKLGTFRAYQKSDCIILSQILMKLAELFALNFGVLPSISISTTAAKAFDKCFYDLRSVKANSEFDEFIRLATYGARNEVYSRYGENINHYDVYNMFVSCYDIPVPVGRMRWIKPNIDRGTLAEVFVKVPKDRYIGPLPYRHERQLMFPVGEWGPDWYDMNEIRNAVNQGVDISIRRQLCCDEEPILKEFGEFVGKLRKSAHSYYWKLFGLSLSGKFGQSRWRDSVRHVTDIKDMRGYFPLDKEELYFQTKEYFGGEAPYIKPAISMRIRAEARIRHLNYLLEAHQKHKLYYCDNDSVFTTGELPYSINPQSGELAYLGKAERGYFIRQKLYGYVSEGSLIQRSAGYSDLKLTEDDFKGLLEGKEIMFLDGNLPDYNKIMKEKELKWLERSRCLRDTYASNRVTVGLETEPICLPLK